MAIFDTLSRTVAFVESSGLEPRCQSAAYDAHRSTTHKTIARIQLRVIESASTHCASKARHLDAATRPDTSSGFADLGSERWKIGAWHLIKGG